MKKLTYREIDDEINHLKKSSYERNKHFETDHSGAWIGPVIIMVGILIALVISYAIHEIFRHI